MVAWRARVKCIMACIELCQGIQVHVHVCPDCRKYTDNAICVCTQSEMPILAIRIQATYMHCLTCSCMVNIKHVEHLCLSLQLRRHLRGSVQAVICLIWLCMINQKDSRAWSHRILYMHGVHAWRYLTCLCIVNIKRVERQNSQIPDLLVHGQHRACWAPKQGALHQLIALNLANFPKKPLAWPVIHKSAQSTP